MSFPSLKAMLDPKTHPPTTHKVTFQLRSKLKATGIITFYKILNRARTNKQLTYKETDTICEALLRHLSSRTSREPLLPLNQALYTFLGYPLPANQDELISHLKQKISNNYQSA